MRSPMVRSPLNALDVSAGATFRDVAGYPVVESYGSEVDEAVTARISAAVVDRSDRCKVRVTGEDRLTFLDGLVTNDVKALGPGRVLHAAVLTDKARVVGDLWMYGFRDHYILDIARDLTDKVLDYFERHLISDDVELTRVDGMSHVTLVGPRAAWLMPPVLRRRTVPRAGRYLAVEDNRYAEIILARTDPLRIPGFDVFALRGSLRNAWRGFLAHGAVPAGRAAWEILRIEAGVPRVGVDADEDVLALEARLDDAISLTKGCYVGQEVVARGTHIGHVRKHLTGLVVQSDVEPLKGDPILAGESKVGYVTSAAWSPRIGFPIALGYLRDEYAKPGTTLALDRGGWTMKARVTALPFVA